MKTHKSSKTYKNWIQLSGKGIVVLSAVAFCAMLFAKDSEEFSAFDNLKFMDYSFFPLDSSDKDTSKLKFPIKDKNPNSNTNYSNNLDLEDPPNIKTEYRYNPTTNKYEKTKKIGNTVVSTQEISFEDYVQNRFKQDEKDYFKQKSKASAFAGGHSGTPKLGIIPDVVTDLIGNGLIDIQPSGSAELMFGGNFNTIKNPQLPARQQKTGQFDFDQKIQLNVRGNIGDRIQMGIKYDTEATFDFENETNLDWVGKKDDIIKKIELGNVSLPLNGSLISGGQGLFGIKTEFQFGRLRMTNILTQDKGESNSVEVKGGAQITEFNIQAHEYDANRHYFLSQFFKDNYDDALANLPAVLSTVSIEKIEVWVTNKNGSINQPRDVVSLMDLGENNPDNNAITPGTDNFPDNKGSNDLYNKLTSPSGTRLSSEIVNNIETNFAGNLKPGLDYDLVNYARMLSENEFEINRQLGYISLNTALNNDEVLAVSFQYYYQGQLHKVGDFTQDVPLNSREANVLFTKMLKPSLMRTNLPVWDLMMKNIYSLGTYNLNTDDLRFNVVYADDKSGAKLNYLPVEDPMFANKRPLISAFNMDRVNRQQEAKPDGILDVLQGITVDTRRGRIIFPLREPFGDFLKENLSSKEDQDKYEFRALYDSTKFWAEQDVFHNKFFLTGSFKGNSSSRISLGAFNIPRNSVRVELNGSPLTENADYIVDYNIGEVTIINESILASGGIIKASFENNALFNVQQKSLLGTRLDYTVSPNFALGGTFMHMYERPLTPKTNIGDEPLKNSIFGFDGSYTRKSRFLTKMVDKLPFLETKAESSITIEGEFAKIIPHEAKALGKAKGVSYIDDFEAAETPYDLRSLYNWFPASTPQGQMDLFPETGLGNDKRRWMDRRANIAWYNIDPLYNRNDRFTPDNIKKNIQHLSNHYIRRVTVKEVFKNKDIPTGTGVPNVMSTMDISYFPKQRGQYNFNANPADWYADGKSSKPEENWGGIMSRITVNDFEAANIDYLEIWVMDPFIYNSTSKGGDLYLNFGNISEDILPDGRKAFENGIPEDGDMSKLAQTRFGYAPLLPSITNSFSADEAYRTRQDVGLDLLDDDAERIFWDTAFLKPLEAAFGTGSKIYQDALMDPANDNFLYHRDPLYDSKEALIIERYSRYNYLQGNASTKQLADGTPASASYTPDIEDINGDNTSNITEDYYQYKIKISPQDLVVGQNYVTDKVLTDPIKLANGRTDQINWYQLKIPISDFEKRVGNIPDFKSIRFMRMYLKGFEDSVTLRFAQMQLVRADWRRYQNSLKDPGVIIPTDPGDDTKFNVSTVNVEENSTKFPVNYVIPPGITREDDRTDPNASAQQNEQSLSLEICNLKANDARAVYKTSNIDARNYKNIKLFVHAEGDQLQDGEMSAFIRIGTDLVSNYYEYEVPLNVTAAGATAAGDVWPAANNLDFVLSKLHESKLDRDELGGSITKPYTISDGANNITIMGNPNLSNLKVLMLGVRNKTDKPICGEIWFNELRLQGINNRGGWAANARIITKLADFSTINASGSIKTIGFGAVDQSLNERALEDTRQFNVSTNTELGKFFSQKSGISIPMYVGYSETHILPKYYPLVPDVELQTRLDKAKSAEERDSVRDAAIDFTSRYSVNFTNVKKNKVGGATKTMPWSISNFNATYAYSREYRHNQEILESDANTYHGSLGYSYSPSFKGYTPFKKVIKSKKLDIIKDINFNPLPSSVNVRADVDRYYSELQYRTNDAFAFESPRLYDKLFTMTRVYNVNWSLTKSLKLDYSANTNARIVEPFGELNTEEKKDSVRQSFYNFGTMSKYNQTTSLSYALPFNKIKMLNWVSASTRYSANYAWDQAPPASNFLGNTIQNSQVVSVNGQLNFVNLYNKSEKLRNLTRGERGRRPSVPDTSAKKKNDNNFVKGVLKGVLMLKNASITYTKNRGTVLPGFQPSIDYFGQNFNRNQPGWEFIFGSQNPEIRYNLANAEGLSNDPRQYNYYTQTVTENYNGKITLQPFTDFRVNLDFKKQEGSSFRSSFRYDTLDGFNEFRDIGVINTRTYSVSYIFWRTAFTKDNKNNTSPIFQEFGNNRFVTAKRLQVGDGRVISGIIDPTTNFPLGYTKTSQEVLLPSFLAAYTGKNSANQNLSPFPKVPLPSWNVNYNGIGKMDMFKDLFSNFTLKHAYSGTYTVGGITNNLDYDPNESPIQGESFQTLERITQATIIESLSPLLGVDATFKNGWNVKTEYKQSRNVNFFISAFSVTETKSSEFVVGAGYRSDDVKLPIKIRGRRVYLTNDFNFHLDVSVRNDKTIVRKLDQPLEEPTNGNRIILINPTIDYMLNEKLNLNLFYMRSMSKPATTISFPTALTEFGVKIRYTIQ